MSSHYTLLLSIELDPSLAVDNASVLKFVLNADSEQPSESIEGMSANELRSLADAAHVKHQASMHSRRSFSVAIVALLAGQGALADDFVRKLVEAARERTRRRETYDGAYRKIGYPLGDVPDNLGVCTDLVVRAYRRQGIDLQVLVHEDMTRTFRSYPTTWGMKQPDPNIDHRRVPNLQVFLARKGATYPISRAPTDYRAGRLVTWRLPGNLPHIGIVSDQFVQGTQRPKIIHNIGAGPVEDDILFSHPITGHYRYPK